MNILGSEIQKIRANYRTYGVCRLLWVRILLELTFGTILFSPLKQLGFRFVVSRSPV